MKGLQLVGYTADLNHLVVDEVDGGGRFRVPLDEDLVATVREVLERLPDDHPLAAALEPWDATSPSSGAGDPPTPGDRAAGPVAAPVVVDADGDPVGPAGPGAPRRRSAALAGTAVLAVRARDAARSAASGSGRRSSLLSPREIQVLLRAGVGTGLVAQRAQTDEDWVRRWLPPIQAERERVLSQAFTARVAGPARATTPPPALGDAVREHLRAAGSDPDGDDVEWQVTRRELDTSWTVTFRHDGRDGHTERARWRFDPDPRRLEALDDRARELGGVAAVAPAPAAVSPPPVATAGPRAERRAPAVAAPPAVRPDAAPAPTDPPPAAPSAIAPRPGDGAAGGRTAPPEASPPSSSRVPGATPRGERRRRRGGVAADVPTAGGATPEDATPEDATPEDATPEDATPEGAAMPGSAPTGVPAANPTPAGADGEPAPPDTDGGATATGTGGAAATPRRRRPRGRS